MTTTTTTKCRRKFKNMTKKWQKQQHEPMFSISIHLWKVKIFTLCVSHFTVSLIYFCLFRCCSYHIWPYVCAHAQAHALKYFMFRLEKIIKLKRNKLREANQRKIYAHAKHMKNVFENIEKPGLESDRGRQ